MVYSKTQKKRLKMCQVNHQSCGHAPPQYSCGSIFHFSEIIYLTLSSDSIQVSCGDSAIPSTAMLFCLDCPSSLIYPSLLSWIHTQNWCPFSMSYRLLSSLSFSFFNSSSWPWENCKLFFRSWTSGQVVHSFIIYCFNLTQGSTKNKQYIHTYRPKVSRFAWFQM